MTDNNTPNWFRAFGRSRSSTPTQQQHPPLPTEPHSATTESTSAPFTTTTPSSFSSSTTRLGSRDNLLPLPLLPLPSPATTTSTSTTSLDSSSSSAARHRKSASATLRTVSSFLSLKSASASRGNNNNNNSNASLVSGGRGGGGASASILNLDAGGRQQENGGGGDYGETASSGYKDGGAASKEGGGGGSDGGGGGGGGWKKAEREQMEKSTPQETWHNPSLLQMAETLGTVMMMGAARDGLPKSYNSTVLALIEGLYRLTQQLRDAREELAEVKTLREKELDQFRDMTEEWVEKGEQYRAEIKRLELALAKESKDGVASVALMRQGSVVDRVGSKRFHNRLKRFSNSGDEEATAEETTESPTAESVEDLAEATSSYRTLGSLPRILDAQSDILMSRIVEQREVNERRARQQPGRVRAAPVFIHAHGLPESRNVLEDAVREHEVFDAARLRAAYELDRTERLLNNTELYEGIPPRLNVRTQTVRDPELSSENEASSSESDSDPESSLARDVFKARLEQHDEANDGKQKTTSENSDQEDSELPNVIGLTSQLLPSGEIQTQSGAEQNPTIIITDDAGCTLKGKGKATQHRRQYSFETGDDETLPVTPLTYEPEAGDSSLAAHAQDGSTMTQHHHESEQFLAEASGEGALPRDSAPVAEQSVGCSPSRWDGSGSGPGSVAHSDSTSTVRWVGDAGGGGDVHGSISGVEYEFRRGG